MRDYQLKSGDLVKIKRAGVGVPEDTLGLIIRCRPAWARQDGATSNVFEVQICDVSPLGTHRIVRRIDRDLEVINKGS